MKYLIIIEETKTGHSAYSPDLEGCIATGTMKEEVEEKIKEAITFHLEGLKEKGNKIPQYNTYSKYVEIGITTYSSGRCNHHS